MRRLVSLASLLVLSTVLTAQQSGLTSAQIEKPAMDSWPTYNGDYSGRRFSPLTKINASNVKNLSLAWIYDLTGGSGALKATPLHVNGVLYFATPDHAYAVESADRPRSVALHLGAEPRRHAHRQPRHGRARRLGVLPHARLQSRRAGHQDRAGEVVQGILLARADVLRLGRAGGRQGQADRRRQWRRSRPARVSRRARSQDRGRDLAVVRDAADRDRSRASRPGRISTWPSTAAA